MPGRHVGGNHHSSHHSSHSSHHSYHHSSHHSTHNSHHSSHSYHHNNNANYYFSGNRLRSGCISILIIYLLIFVVVPIVSLLLGSIRFADLSNDSNFSNTTNGNTSYTVGNYEKIDTLPSVHNTEYVEDNIDIITDERKVVRALRYFELKTGICPALVTEATIPNNNGYASDSEIERYVISQYDERFDDEQHMIFYYFSDIDTQGVIWGETGNEADKYMDDDAWDILFDEVEAYLINDNPQKAFTTGFMNAADKLSGN